MKITIDMIILVAIIGVLSMSQPAQAALTTSLVFIIPKSTPITVDSKLTASLINPDGSSGQQLTWTYNGTGFIPQNEVEHVWADDYYIDFHDSDVNHYNFAIQNGTVGQRYSMCLEMNIVYEYDKQCQWQVIDQTGLAFANFEQPTRDTSKTQFYFWLPGEYKQYLHVGTKLSAMVDDFAYSWKYNGSQFNYSGEGTDTNSDDPFIDCCGENDYLFAVPYKEPIGKQIDMRIESPGSRVSLADSLNEGVYAIDSKPFGSSYEDWTIKFWQWLLSIPVPRNPAVDQTGEFCQEKQDDQPVFFLVFSGSGGADRTCNIPAGKAILIPINVVECSFAELPAAKTEEELHTCATEDESSNPGLFLSVDGREFKELEKYRVHSRAFDINLPNDPWLPGKPGPSHAVSDGYWVILEPLPPGKHEINFKASLTDPKTGILFYSDDLKYNVNVG